MNTIVEELDTPEPTEPIDTVLDRLISLWVTLQHHQKSSSSGSMLEKYNYFIHNSDRQRACTYAMKSKQLFLLCDWQNVQKDILSLLEAIRQVKGYEDFGVPKE